MSSEPTPRRVGRATVLTGFAGLAIVAGGAGIAAATTGDGPSGSTVGTDVGYGVVVDAPTTPAAGDTDCPWGSTTDDGATDTSLAGAR